MKTQQSHDPTKSLNASDYIFCTFDAMKEAQKITGIQVSANMIQNAVYSRQIEGATFSRKMWISKASLRSWANSIVESNKKARSEEVRHISTALSKLSDEEKDELIQILKESKIKGVN